MRGCMGACIVSRENSVLSRVRSVARRKREDALRLQQKLRAFVAMADDEPIDELAEKVEDLAVEGGAGGEAAPTKKKKKKGHERIEGRG